MGCVCLKVNKRFIYIYIYIHMLAPSVLGPNLQLPAHELISPVARSGRMSLSVKSFCKV